MTLIYKKETKKDLLKRIRLHKLDDGRISESDTRGAMVSWLNIADKVTDGEYQYRVRLIKALIEEYLTFQERMALIPGGVLSDDDFEFISCGVVDVLLKRPSLWALSPCAERLPNQNK
jgi:hypothetical protein